MKYYEYDICCQDQNSQTLFTLTVIVLNVATLRIAMPNVVMLCVVMLRVITLNVAILPFDMLNVVMLIVTAQSVGMLKDFTAIANAFSVFGAVGCDSRG
jgi:hypothetical protein